MSEEATGNGRVRDVLREVLQELLPGIVAGALDDRLDAQPSLAPQESHDTAPPRGATVSRPADTTQRDAPIPQVPAPPVASVHRPSTWSGAEPSARAPQAEASRPAVGAGRRGTVEEVTIDSDADLDAFVRRLLHRYENPRDRQALRSGQLRFALRRRAEHGAGAPVVRVEKGAVTERAVKQAAAAGARLVLGPAAVLTPMARDRARALHVEIEREKRC